MAFQLGIIEGFFGQPWSWQERQQVCGFLAQHGYGFYLYAPKADVFLRRRWQEPHPPAEAKALTAFGAFCRSQGVRFGVGLSPYEAYRQFDQTARDALARKLAAFDEMGVEDLALLFDDMSGDSPELADRQAEIIHWAKGQSNASRVLTCPSYYSDDPVLDRVFGRRPDDYLERLGELLDPDVEVFWTGEEVCAREVSVGHLDRVAKQLRRKPFLWDNYPVNDGERMSRFLHLRGFTGRPATLRDHLAGHGINPALQPTLSCIPALTLAESYRSGADYEYGQAQTRASQLVLGEELGGAVGADLLTLQDAGLDRLSDTKKAQLRARYACYEHPGAAEIVRWLAGNYGVTDEQVKTQ
ncbi:beta-N-acetylglucosaminidase domain-containing protein [Marinobacter caseinilyticus]|uniref:beta-N-acetylglucosaminidase domain-containing protein n=1 Tax=Marinobacter caseinilyticus TaxID=2692195 RepID=UPI00140C4EF3|nr:beta-N-acetylglucosaminidase domain-containing protein [Marinobacter caseinilyticus]